MNQLSLSLSLSLPRSPSLSLSLSFFSDMRPVHWLRWGRPAIQHQCSSAPPAKQYTPDLFEESNLAPTNWINSEHVFVQIRHNWILFLIFRSAHFSILNSHLWKLLRHAQTLPLRISLDRISVTRLLQSFRTASATLACPEQKNKLILQWKHTSTPNDMQRASEQPNLNPVNILYTKYHEIT